MIHVSFHILYHLRRKVIQYMETGCDNGIDATDGHGTHVSSIAVGSIIGGDLFDGRIAQYSGVAPGGKLAMFDLGSATDLCIPKFTDLIEGAQLAGARVFSYSWQSSGVSSYQTADIDLYLFLNQVPSPCKHCIISTILILYPITSSIP